VLNKYHIDYVYLDKPVYYGDTLFMQLGRLWFSPGSGVGKHAHGNLYELTVVTDGCGTVCTNGVPSEVSGGDIYLSYPGDFHEIYSSEDNPMKYDFFAFNTKNETLRRELERITENWGCAERVFRDSQITSAVSNALAEYASKEKYCEEILAHIFEQIIYYTVRNFSEHKPVLKSKYTVSADELCYRMMYFIDTNIYAVENLAVLSEVFNYNYSYLSDIFKKTTGNTLSEYYHSRRLDTAALLLKENRLSVKEIGEMLKYSTPYSFSKAFKNRFGKSPLNYKKEKG